MKDKLVKTGHKKTYYRARRLLSLTLATSIFGLVLSLPVMISIHTVQAKAEAATDTLSQKVEIEEDGVTLLEYQD